MARRGSFCIILALLLTQGCTSEQAARSVRSGELTNRQAAELAADLANEECERLYGSRPFAHDDHVAAIKDGRWHWGRLDPAGHAGLSAEVTFNVDGSHPEATVYFSLDIVYID